MNWLIVVMWYALFLVNCATAPLSRSAFTAMLRVAAAVCFWTAGTAFLIEAVLT